MHKMIAKYLKDCISPTPCHGQGHLLLDPVCQSPIQPSLEHFQGRSIHNHYGKSIPVPYTL